VPKVLTYIRQYISNIVSALREEADMASKKLAAMLAALITAFMLALESTPAISYDFGFKIQVEKVDMDSLEYACTNCRNVHYNARFLRAESPELISEFVRHCGGTEENFRRMNNLVGPKDRRVQVGMTYLCHIYQRPDIASTGN